MAYTVESLRETLTTSIASVTFQKADGEVVTRRVTLRPESVPATKGVGRPAAAGVLAVMDLDRSGWRSIKVDNVRNVVVVEG